MDRRKFLQGAAALFCAPAIVRADSLMRIYVPPEPKLIGIDPGAEEWFIVTERMSLADFHERYYVLKGRQQGLTNYQRWVYMDIVRPHHADQLQIGDRFTVEGVRRG